MPLVKVVYVSDSDYGTYEGSHIAVGPNEEWEEITFEELSYLNRNLWHLFGSNPFGMSPVALVLPDSEETPSIPSVREAIANKMEEDRLAAEKQRIAAEKARDKRKAKKLETDRQTFERLKRELGED